MKNNRGLWMHVAHLQLLYVYSIEYSLQYESESVAYEIFNP